jgi:hypothetical protein
MIIRAAAGGPAFRRRRAGNTVYLAGRVADDPSLDAEGQTADVLRRSMLLAERLDGQIAAVSVPGISGRHVGSWRR